MEKFQSKVRKFMEIGEQPTLKTPGFPSQNTQLLAYKLISEELQEFCDSKTIVDVADSLGDLLFVVMWACNAYGIDIEPVFDEIFNSNMTKFPNGKVLKNKFGKIIKPDSYTPPDLKKVLIRLCQKSVY